MLIELTVLASVYCDIYISDGSRMDCNRFSVASRTIILNSCVLVFYRGRSVIAIVNDRGPCYSGKCHPRVLKRELDLSTGTAKKLHYPGSGKIKYKIVDCN